MRNSCRANEEIERPGPCLPRFGSSFQILFSSLFHPGDKLLSVNLWEYASAVFPRLLCSIRIIAGPNGIVC